MIALASRRTVLGVLALGLAACETQPSRPPASPALRPPLPTATEPAPLPSDSVDGDGSRRGRALQAAPRGPDAMPGLAGPPAVGADMQMAPIPANRIR
jgi:hypothetical protein